MPKIEISQESLNWLKKNMNTKEYSVEQVVDRLIDRYKKEISPPPGPIIVPKLASESDSEYEKVYRPQLRGGELNSRDLPGLLYTKISSARVKGHQVRGYWNIVREEVFGGVGTVSALQQLPFKITMHKGYVGGEYAYIRKLDISLRRRDADRACSEAVCAALIHDIELDIQYYLRQTGERGRIVVGDF